MTVLGACVGLDDDTMFPDPKELSRDDYAADITFAKSICAACPFNVRQACLSGALIRGEKHGVWGGHSTEERYALLDTIKGMAA